MTSPLHSDTVSMEMTQIRHGKLLQSVRLYDFGPESKVKSIDHKPVRYQVLIFRIEEEDNILVPYEGLDLAQALQAYLDHARPQAGPIIDVTGMCKAKGEPYGPIIAWDVANNARLCAPVGSKIIAFMSGRLVNPEEYYRRIYGDDAPAMMERLTMLNM